MNGADELLDAFCEAAGADPHEARTTAPAPRTASSSSRASSASAPATSRRWLDRRALLRPARRRRRARRDRGAARRRASRCPRRRSPGGRRPADPSPRPIPRLEGPTLPETRVLFRHIDEPGLATIEGYREHGGYKALERVVPRARPRGPDRQLRGLGPARPRRRRLLDGQEGLVPAPRRDEQVRLLQRRRVRARGVQGPRADAEEPASADRGGARSRRSRSAPPTRSSSSAASTGRSPTSSTAPSPRPTRPNFLGTNVLDTGKPGRARRPPRRRRLHLRRGDGAARRARGQARQPAAEAAVPGDPGPLRRADADQQRRDALQPAAHRQQRRRTGSRASAPSSRRGPRWSRSRAASSGPATTRSSSGSPRGSSSSTSPAGPPRAAG